MVDEDSMLMQLCTENVYNDNIFHLLNLQTTATPRLIRRRQEDLESAHEMGEEAWKREFGHLLGNRPVPSFEEVRAAFEHLEDPEYRIVSEFFWMWPLDEDDIALKELTEGKRSTAIKTWEQVALGYGGKRLMAQHNLAILYQLYAIDAELQAIDLDDDPPADFHKTMCDYWERSFEYWEGLADNDDFWEIFEERMRKFDDPRLIGDFARRFRQQFPIAFDNINARLAAKYAKHERFVDAKRHVDCMLKTMSDLNDVNETMRILFEPTFTKLKRLIEKYNQIVKALPQKGLDAANEIIDATMDDYKVICGLLGGENPTNELHVANTKLRRLQYDPKESPSQSDIDKVLNEVKDRESLLRIRESLYDPIVSACFNYLFKYSEATKDWDITIKWDEYLGKLAVSEKLKKTINNDLLSIFRVQINDLISEYGKLVKDNAKRGTWAIGQLVSKSKPLLATIEVRYGVNSGIAVEIRNQLVGASRSFLISYGNETKDWEGCFPFLKTIKTLVPDLEMERRLEEDFKILSENVQQKALQWQCWHCHCKNDEKSKIVFAMYGDVIYTSLERMQWNIIDVVVPLCRKCKALYYCYCLLLCIIFGSLLSVPLGIETRSWQGVPILCVVGVLVGILCCRFIRNRWFNEHPGIKSALVRGYKYGKKPSNV